MLKREDRPLVYALSVVAFALFLNVCASPVFPSGNTASDKTNTETKKGGGEKVSMGVWIRGWVADDYIAAFTLLTAGIFFFQFLAALRDNRHFRITERAYVQMSHEGGLEFVAGTLPTIRMQIRNWGNTPAKIIRSAQRLDIRGADDPLPDDPVYVFGNDSQSGFLVKNAFMNWPQTFFDTPIAQVSAQAGNMAVRIIGCVEYEDQFGDRHQARYARRYRHGIELAAALRGESVIGINNLVFEMAPGYNDDVPID